MVSDEFKQLCEDQYLPQHRTYTVRFKFANYGEAIMCDSGVCTFQYNEKRNGDMCIFERVFTWHEFKIINFYTMPSKRHETTYYTFILNGTKYQEYPKEEMISVLEKNCKDCPKRKDLINNLMTQFIDYGKSNGDITELQPTDILGYLPEKGWVLPDKYFFVAGNEIREQFEANIKKVLEMTIDPAQAIKWFQDIYNLTTIDYKDIIFAYALISPFLYALRKEARLMPFLSLNADGEKGKSIIQEFSTCKIWGHYDSIVGGRILSTQPRIDALFTATTFPLSIDDCADLPAYFLGLAKRFTTTEESISKLNPDQSIKMRGKFCTPCELNWNDLPSIYDDIQMRQRIITLFPKKMKKNDEWIKLYNQIIPGYIGKYIIDKTRDLTYNDLKALYYRNIKTKLSGRQKDELRILEIGRTFAKDFFNIDLNFEGIEDIILNGLKVGNDDFMGLVRIMLKEGSHFVSNSDNALENPRKKSWVNAPVSMIDYKGTRGYILNADNACDLAKRLGRNTAKFGLKTISGIIKTEWDSVSYGNFYYNSEVFRGVFIPNSEVNGDKIREEEGPPEGVSIQPMNSPSHIEKDDYITGDETQ